MTAPPEVILLVDDEPLVLVFARQVLRRAGYEVVTASGGEGAVDYARSPGARLDLLLTDVRMPGLGGREVAEQVLADRPGLPVLFISGFHDDAVLEDGVRKGTVHLLSKPFRGADVTVKVRELLDARCALTPAAAG